MLFYALPRMGGAGRRRPERGSSGCLGGMLGAAPAPVLPGGGRSGRAAGGRPAGERDTGCGAVRVVMLTMVATGSILCNIIQEKGPKLL